MIKYLIVNYYILKDGSLRAADAYFIEIQVPQGTWVHG